MSKRRSEHPLQLFGIDVSQASRVISSVLSDPFSFVDGIISSSCPSTITKASDLGSRLTAPIFKNSKRAAPAHSDRPDSTVPHTNRNSPSDLLPMTSGSEPRRIR